MKRWPYTANCGFYGLRRDRFTQYQPPASLEDRIRRAAATPGVTGVELKYPFDFEDVGLIRTLLDETGLTLSAVNVDIKDAQYFRFGALAASDPKARDKAVELLTAGMDLAAEFGANLVSTCPLADGYDYPFSVDFTDAWGRYIETVTRVCHHREDVNLALEFQPHEPHAHIMLNNVGKMLYVCHAVGLPNIGANLDVGHSFAALEAPAESAALLARENRLFYLHSSDNTGDGGDWDMISGTVHFWHWIELMLTLERIGYDGWIGGDILAKYSDAENFYATNIHMIEAMIGLIESVGADSLRELVSRDGTGPEIYRLLTRHLVPNMES
ncbi:MAG: sugar phosphate isomerase/epimerase [Rhodospirillales bacterium]|nr:sugar phosphate isomerase/epimerase [Rhodospirillales bacterium]